MPVYVVTLRVNVPGPGPGGGERIFTTPGLSALDIADAIKQAVATIIIEPTHVNKTGV